MKVECTPDDVEWALNKAMDEVVTMDAVGPDNPDEGRLISLTLYIFVQFPNIFSFLFFFKIDFSQYFSCILVQTKSSFN